MDKIKEYFASQNLSAYSYQRNIAGFERNPDIAQELYEWLSSQSYADENAIRIEGYSAKDISQMAPFLDGAGSFNFLITLREKPEKAKAYIKSGFARK